MSAETLRPRPCSARSQNHRRGATTLEMAIALSLFLALVLGMVDLGYGVFRQHVLSQATRQLARRAIVRGELSERLEVWGPQEILKKASDSHDVTAYIAPKLIGWDLDEVDVHVKWIDGDNDIRKGDRVQVKMSAPFRPTIGYMLGKPTIDLHASSTMYIAH